MPGLAIERPEGVIKAADVVIAISTSGRNEAHAGTGLPALLENIALQRQIVSSFGEPSTTDSYDVLSYHRRNSLTWLKPVFPLEFRIEIYNFSHSESYHGLTANASRAIFRWVLIETGLISVC